MDKLYSIISDYVGVNADEIDENMSLGGDIGLDSFGLISLLCSIEDAYNVRIPDYEIPKFQTLKDLNSYLLAHSPLFADKISA